MKVSNSLINIDAYNTLFEALDRHIKNITDNIYEWHNFDHEHYIDTVMTMCINGALYQIAKIIADTDIMLYYDFKMKQCAEEIDTYDYGLGIRDKDYLIKCTANFFEVNPEFVYNLVKI